MTDGFTKSFDVGSHTFGQDFGSLNASEKYNVALFSMINLPLEWILIMQVSEHILRHHLLYVTVWDEIFVIRNVIDYHYHCR